MQTRDRSDGNSNMSFINYKQQREQRFRRLFDESGLEASYQSKCVTGKIRLPDRIISAQLKFNPLFLYIKQVKQPKVYDENFFLLFWSQIKKIRCINRKTHFEVKFSLKDKRKFFVEIKYSHIRLFIKSASYFLRPYFDSPRALQAMKKINKSDLLNNIDPINNSIKKTSSFSSKNIMQKVSSRNMTLNRKKDLLLDFSFSYLHSNLLFIKKKQTLTERFGLKFIKNTNFHFCSSYPDIYIMPKQLTETDIERISDFRTSGRMPMLSFINHNGQLLFRSSQIRTGLFSKRAPEDEMLLYYMGQPTSQLTRTDFFLNPSKQQKVKNLQIFDCRSKTAAVANRFIGKGYENCRKYYINAHISFNNIANIHTVRNSFKKLQINRKRGVLIVKKFLNTDAEVEWYSHITDILNCSKEIARTLEEGKNVLVHCSDGWDRTSQVSALSQIILDPKFRKIKGFLNLIEKEFSNAGYQFSKRKGVYNGEKMNYTMFANVDGEMVFRIEKDDDISPIFLQFLESVRQLIHQNIDCFEFGLSLIDELAYCHDHSLFKELCFDNQRVRNKFNEFCSMFDYFNEHFNFFKNEGYTEQEKQKPIQVKTEGKYMHKWTQLLFENVPYSSKTLVL